MNFYVGYADIKNTVDDMKNGIVSQGVEVVDLEEIPQGHNCFKSFKLCTV